MAEYIEREDLLKWMKEEKPKFYTEHGYFHGMTVSFDYAIKFVEQMPAADVVEVVHGEWLKTKYPEQYQCSECYYEWTVRGMCRETPRDNDAFYCPCCGAQMDKENE